MVVQAGLEGRDACFHLLDVDSERLHLFLYLSDATHNRVESERAKRDKSTDDKLEKEVTHADSLLFCHGVYPYCNRNGGNTAIIH